MSRKGKSRNCKRLVTSALWKKDKKYALIGLIIPVSRRIFMAL
jgi:hypothetical protein